MTRFMLGLNSTSAPAQIGVSGKRPSAPMPGFNPAQAPTLIPTFITLVSRVREELESNLSRLLSLNPSRREAVAQHLDRLAGHTPGPTHSTGSADAAAGLRRWVDGPRSPAQNAALRTFFEEVARIALGQAILLKAWSDRGLRAWREEDLSRLNWALSSALKPHVPLDREGWQITRPNLYSWYNPGPELQRDIWNALESWRVSDEGPSLLAALMRLGHTPDGGREPGGYDERFFVALWENLGHFGFQASHADPIRRKKAVFSPTLRDGAMVRTGPAALSWVGLESHSFPLMLAELVQLWWGPSAPPLWAMGSGLEVHSREQLALALGSPKPSLLTRISEMEACDLAFVLEERSVHTSGRSVDSAQFREQIETLPYFRKLKAQGTSLGDLQACVSLSKLRPGGLLLWAREAPLSSNDGAELLRFLLDRAKLRVEWDFSAVGHTLPLCLPLFPKYLYAFEREPDLTARSAHRPLKISVEGQIRSHVEVPLMLADALQSGVRGAIARAHWQTHAHSSPLPQKDWSERWPEPTGHDTHRAMEELRKNSMQLAAVCTVRPTPQGDPAKEGGWTVSPAYRGVWISSEGCGDARSLVVRDLPNGNAPAFGSGHLVLVPDESWNAPLRAYLESESIRLWIDYHAERRSDRWVLTEQVVKFIPMAKPLLAALGCDPEASQGGQSFARPLPGDWEKLASDVVHHAQGNEAIRSTRDRLGSLARDEQGLQIRASLFVRVARAIEQIRSTQGRLLEIVTPEGAIRWKQLLDILPRSEVVAVTLHPKVRLSGTLPGQLPVSRIDRVKAPMPGILLSTESGFSLHLGSESGRVLDMLADQLDGVTHPTWSELMSYLKLPRNLELAEATAGDVLRSHGEQVTRLRELNELLGACSRL